MNTNQMGMHVVIAGNPVSGIKIYGPFKTSDHAVGWASTWVGGDWCVAPLQAPERLDVPEPKTEWQGPFANPFAAAITVAAPDPEKIAAVQNAVRDVFTWDDVYGKDLLDDMLQEIAGKTCIVVQHRNDGWYAALDKE